MSNIELKTIIPIIKQKQLVLLCGANEDDYNHLSCQDFVIVNSDDLHETIPVLERTITHFYLSRCEVCGKYYTSNVFAKTDNIMCQCKKSTYKTEPMMNWVGIFTDLCFKPISLEDANRERWNRGLMGLTHLDYEFDPNLWETNRDVYNFLKSNGCNCYRLYDSGNLELI